MMAALLLAHLIGDYPLQPGWMVRAKNHLPGLLLHVGIHLICLLLLAGRGAFVLWPYLVGLAVCHFAIDAFKAFLGRWRPNWITGPYLFDQLLHLLSILAVNAWIQREIPGLPALLPVTWLILLNGYLTATYVWYISELVFWVDQPSRQLETIQDYWGRMAGRGLLLTGMLWMAPTTQAAARSSLLAFSTIPYLRQKHGKQALLIDFSVSLTVAVLVYLAQR